MVKLTAKELGIISWALNILSEEISSMHENIADVKRELKPVDKLSIKISRELSARARKRLAK